MPPGVRWPRSGTNDREVASRGRVSREQIEVTAQGAAVLGHLLAPVELGARGVAFTLLDKGIHLERQQPRGQSLRIGCSHDASGATGRVETAKSSAGRRKVGHRGGSVCAKGSQSQPEGLTFTSMSATCMSQAL